MSSNKLKSIWSRYSVSIIMVPSIILLHYGWYLVQFNRALVSEEEQIDLPVVTFAKYCWRQVKGESALENESQKIKNAANISSK